MALKYLKYYFRFRNAKSCKKNSKSQISANKSLSFWFINGRLDEIILLKKQIYESKNKQTSDISKKKKRKLMFL